MEEIIVERKKVAKILRDVLVGKLPVRNALLLYPKDTEDESLIACYHALIHFEADEDLRRRDLMYKQEQDDYIEFLVNTLEQGSDIPINIINNYKKYYETAPILHENNKSGFIKSFFRNLTINKKD